MSPTRSSKTSSRPVPYGHFTRYPTASPTSAQTTIPSITYTELVNYFDVANDQLYDLLDGDEELHQIIYAIKTLQASNRTLKELQERQCKGTPLTAPTHPHIRASHSYPQCS